MTCWCHIRQQSWRLYGRGIPSGVGRRYDRSQQSPLEQGSEIGYVTLVTGMAPLQEVKEVQLTEEIVLS